MLIFDDDVVVENSISRSKQYREHPPLPFVVDRMSFEVDVYTIERERESRDGVRILSVDVVEGVDSRFG